MKDNPNILIVQIGKIGDMILTTPLLIRLKELFPHCTVSVLASPRNKSIAEVHRCVDNVHVYDKKLLSSLRLFAKLRSEKFDFWIDTKDELSSTSKFLVKLCNPALSLGFNLSRSVFDIDLKDFVNGSHRVDINLSPVNYFIKSKDYTRSLPEINIPENDYANVIKRISNITGFKILLNLSAGLSTRDFSMNKWKEIVQGLDTNCSVILTGEKKDYDKINEIINSVNRQNVFFVETNSIFELAELIKNSNLLVTPDTSAVHIASCFNTPIVCFFHSVEWVRIKFAPLSSSQKVIVSSSDSSFESVTPSSILSAVNELINTGS